MKGKRFVKAAVSTVAAAAVAATVCMPAGAIEFTPPSSSVDTNDNVIKCFAGRVARFNPVLLGGDLVATSSINIGNNADNLAGVIGSELNDKYDPWIWNLAYNSAAAETDQVNNATIATDVADGTSPTAEQYAYLLTHRPDLILNQGAKDGGAVSMGSDNANLLAAISEFDENVGKSVDEFGYNPTIQTCSIGTLYYQTQNVKNVAATMKAICEKTGKTTRYGDPAVIANNFEKYVWGTYSYLLKKIDNGDVKKKTVAVLSSTADNGATWTAPGVNTTANAAKPNRLVEYVRDYCNTPLNVASANGANTTVSISDIKDAKCDVIIASGKGEVLENALAEAGVQASDMPVIINTLPNTIVGIVMQSNENGFGLPYFASLIYGEEAGLNPVYTAAYWYQNFLHVSDPTKLQTVTSSMLQTADLGGLTVDLSGYSARAVEDMISEGCEYALAMNAKGTPITLHSSDAAFVPDMTEGIGRNLSVATMSIVMDSYKFTGSAIKPTPTVKIDGVALKKNTDFTVSYSNNVVPGTATITVTGTGNYKGTASMTFTIEKGQSGNFNVALDEDTFVYTGAKIEPAVTVTYGKTTLVKGAHYSVSYVDNIDAGNASVIVSGIGYYEGSVISSFTIEKAPVDMSGVAFANKTVAYNGGKQELTVSGTLPAGVTVSYSGNALSAVGTSNATATFACDANHVAPAAMNAVLTVTKGNQTVSCKTVSVKQSSLTKSKTVTLRLSGVASGKTQYSLSKKAKKAGMKISGKKLTIKKGTKKGSYTFKVRAAGNSNYNASKYATVKVVVK